MTKMSEEATCIDGAFLSRFPGIEFLPQAVRLLARGRPVALEEIAESAGVSVEQIEALLRGQPGCEWDTEGRLVGFGLTQRPTAHRLALPTGTLYTWCAMDTLFFPLILRARATAESRCPATSRSIRVELMPGAAPSVSPEQAVVSQILAHTVCDIRAEVCDHGHFFASPQAAAGWADQHPDGRVLPVREAFAQAVRACEAMGWLADELALR